MHTPPPEPPPKAGSTGHYTKPQSSLVELFGSSYLRAADEPGDDQPTIITSKPHSGLSTVAGQRLGHFELMEAIGTGGMATVLKARDLDLGRIVALKILPPESARDLEIVTRFKQEARSAARLDDDHIARVYYCGEDRGLHFIAFEFVEGDNLRVLIDRSGTLLPRDCVRYMLDVTAGLKHAAERGVVHRDIKPSNIIITPQGRAKIVDMGLARQFGDAGVNGGVTQSGVTLGTFDYISPEQALDPRRADVRSDIYSLGCAFYHALTGRPPVPEGTAARKLQAHQQEAPTDPRDLNPAVPDDLAVVLAKMMAKDPAARYPSPDALIGDLTMLAQAWELLIDGSPVTPALPSVSLFASEPPRVPTAWLLAGSAVFIAVAVLFGMPGSGTAPSPPPWDTPTPVKPTVMEPATAIPTGPAAEPKSKPVETAKQLADAVQGESPIVRLKSGVIYDLTSLPEGLTFTGQTLTLDCDASLAGPAVLKLTAAAIADERTPRAGSLTVRGAKSVTLRGIELFIADVADDDTSSGDPVAALFANVGRVEMTACRVRSDPQTRSGRIAGIVLTADANAVAPELSVHHALFDLGPQGVAVKVPARAKVECDEVAFAPHDVALSILGDGDEPDVSAGELKLMRSTFLLGRGGAVVQVDATANVRITSGHCLFAAAKAPDEAVMPGVGPPLRPVMLRYDTEPGPKKLVSYGAIKGEPNGYYQTDAIAVGDKHTPIDASFDPAGRRLMRLPWAVTNPLSLLAGGDPAAAFRIRLNDAKLRLPPASEAVVLGAKTINSADTRIYHGPWPPERPQAIKASPSERVVVTDAEPEDAAARIYPSVAAAFADLMPGETLVLAANGRLPVAALPEKTLVATIRAAAGYQPLLVPDGPALTLDASFFRLAAGDLTFDGVQFLLTDRQAIVIAAAGTSCRFRNCIITIAETDEHPAAAVVLPDPAREMKLSATTADDAPRVRFENTLIRGDGRIVWVQAARAFDITFDNCGIALDGPIGQFDPAEKLATSVPRGALKMKNVTAALAGAMFEFKAGRTAMGPPTFVAVDVENCLFAAADPRSTASHLIHIDDVDPGADASRFLEWSASGPLIYIYPEAGVAVEVKGSSDGGWDWPRWQRFARDDGKLLPRLRFANGPLRPKLMTAKAVDLKLTAGSAVDAGVEIEKLPSE